MPELTPSSTFDLVDGDILFQDLNGAGGDAIGAVTPGFHGAKFRTTASTSALLAEDL